jgi:uncharacterized protein
MRNNYFIYLVLALMNPFFSCTNPKNKENGIPIPVEFSGIAMQGELYTRALKNYDRLESDIYQPRIIFDEKKPSVSKDWPGDFEGRTILGLVLEAQATHREPLYLNEIIDMLPSKLNAKGYFGPVQGDTLNEQQLSGHGWLLRGLCEYYNWKKEEKVKKYILEIIRNLALPTRGHHMNYPIRPEDRKTHVGEMSGTLQNVVNNWVLSSDIGCDFIFLDGIVQAYGLFPSDELKDLIDEMVTRFLQMDLISIKAQTHSTLTGLRALMRYYTITGNKTLMTEVISRYQLYREQGMTENYENFNWFCRPEWTEPCAIIDSYILAVQLWQHTQNPQYLEDAHHIYYNAICHTQRANGGFGCDNCPGPAELQLRVKAYEAYWCCTMRGGEGLAKAIQFSYFMVGTDLYVPFFQNSDASVNLGKKSILIRERTTYPFGTKDTFVLSTSGGPASAVLHLFAPSWTSNHHVLVNGRETHFSLISGFVAFPLKIRRKTLVVYSYDMHSQTRENINLKNSGNGSYALVYGPLMLGYDGESEIAFTGKPTINRTDDTRWKVSDNVKSYDFSPIYQLLDPRVKEQDYKKQILFLTSF